MSYGLLFTNLTMYVVSVTVEDRHRKSTCIQYVHLVTFLQNNILIVDTFSIHRIDIGMFSIQIL